MKTFLSKYKVMVTILIVLLLSYTVYFVIEQNTYTDNAFVMTNIRPVASQVSGYISEINVKDGERVKKGQPLFSIRKDLYEYAYQEAKVALDNARLQKDLLQKDINIGENQISIEQDKLENVEQNYMDAKALLNSGGASKVSVDQLRRQYLSQKMNLLIAKEKLSALRIKEKVQAKVIETAKLKVSVAEYDLNHTTTYAETDGTIANLFLSLGTPVQAQKPLFSFVDTSHWYVQANFKETDLGDVRPGDKASIRLRMYLGEKVYMGKVLSINWAVNRQQTNPLNQLQEVQSESQWVLEAQRFPVLIEVLDLDSKFPLHVGASAYVGLETH